MGQAIVKAPLLALGNNLQNILSTRPFLKFSTGINSVVYFSFLRTFKS